MPNHFKIPFGNPFKFVPVSTTPGVHFDDSWAKEQIQRYQMKVFYKQKWMKSDTTKIQIESSIAPQTLKVYIAPGIIVKSFAWTLVHSEISYGVYETTFDISDLAEGVYFLYQKVEMFAITWEVITEPIHSKVDWPDTLPIIYNNSFNDFDIAFSTGIEFLFRCEGGIPNNEMDPKRDTTEFINQERDPTVLKSVPYREFKYRIGIEPGVAPWVIDLLNRIFAMDRVVIKGKRYVAKGDLDVTRFRGYPLVGATQDLLEGSNEQSLQFADTTPLAPGIVTAYNIETGFFGPGTIVPITEIIENG